MPAIDRSRTIDCIYMPAIDRSRTIDCRYRKGQRLESMGRLSEAQVRVCTKHGAFCVLNMMNLC